MTETNTDGLYLFNGLPTGNYIVGIPPTEWNPGQPLENWLPSTPTSTNPNNNIDNDNNGIPDPASSYVMSGPITLSDSEPLHETPDNDPNTADTNSNLTIDFGFWQPNYDLALHKTLATGQPTTVNIGDTATFTIEIINQGNIDATNIQIIDYLPSGMTLNDPNWTTSNTNAVTTLPTTLQAGTSTNIDITVTITATTGLNNHAEIASATPVNVNGITLTQTNNQNDNDTASLTHNTTPPPGPLAFTGQNNRTLTLYATLTTLLGAALLTITRRHNKTQTKPKQT